MAPLLSLAMIVRDEEATIGAVLDDASAFCDELVVLDTGSVDQTVAICREHGALVETFEWIDDFAAARNIAFGYCTGEWILWLDADDRIPSDAQEGFRGLKEHLRGRINIDGVMIPYRRVFSVTDPEKCTLSFDRERILRRAAGLQWQGAVHEVIALSLGRSIRWPGAYVSHRPPPESWARKSDRNLRILQRMVASGDRSPRTLFYYGNELRDHRRFKEALATYREYVAVTDLPWERYSAHLHMAACAAAVDRPDEQVEHLLSAVRFDSSRAEAFNQLGLIYYNRKEWLRAIPFFAAASLAARPEDGFVSEPDYAELPLDYLSVCLGNVGRDQEALDFTLRALVASPDRERLLGNVDYYRRRLADRAPEN